MSLKLVPAGVAIWTKLLQPTPRQRSTRYPLTPAASVDALQERSIRLVLTGVAANPDGAVGGVVSGPAWVVAEPIFELVLMLPAASVARTR